MLTGKAAVITGASGGLGLAICSALNAAGASIIVFDKDQNAVDSAEEALRMVGVQVVLGIPVDVACATSVSAGFKQLDHDGLSPDILVNNAGIREIKPILDLSPTEWDRVVAINLNGPFYCSREAALRMAAAGGGAIVNITSVAGLIGISNRPAYCASKHGLVGLTRNLAFDLAPHRIRVNAIAPGAIRTPLTDAYFEDESFISGLGHSVALKDLGTGTSIGDAVVFLCSERANFITGVTLPVDGGFLAEKSFATPDATSFYSPRSVK